MGTPIFSFKNTLSDKCLVVTLDEVKVKNFGFVTLLSARTQKASIQIQNGCCHLVDHLHLLSILEYFEFVFRHKSILETPAFRAFIIYPELYRGVKLSKCSINMYLKTPLKLSLSDM